MKETLGEKIFNVFNCCLMIVLVIIAIYPIWYILVASLSSGTAVSEGRVIFWIKDFTFAAYRQIFKAGNLGRAFGNTVFYSVVGSLISMVMTTMAAFTLSIRDLPFKKPITLLFMFTMWFGAGMMPTYINIKNLGLLDTRTAILLHEVVSVWNLILMRSFFDSIPSEMEESAKIDGANEFVLFLKIYLPLSAAALATIWLYYFVGRWNAYFWSMILLTDEKKIPLQVVLKKFIVEMNVNFSQNANVDYTVTSRETSIFATIMISVIPMIAIYPFIQKYFVKGIMIGAVKG